MTTKSRISAALAVLTLATSLAIPTSSAQAGHHGGWGIGAGIVGAAIVGAAVANSAPYGGYYVDGYRRCRWGSARTTRPTVSAMSAFPRKFAGFTKTKVLEVATGARPRSLPLAPVSRPARMVRHPGGFV